MGVEHEHADPRGHNVALDITALFTDTAVKTDLSQLRGAVHAKGCIRGDGDL